MLETAWESRWLPDTQKKSPKLINLYQLPGLETARGRFIEPETARWYLPVIRDRMGIEHCVLNTENPVSDD